MYKIINKIKIVCSCLVFLFLFSPELWAGEKLVYAINYRNGKIPRGYISPEYNRTNFFTFDPLTDETHLVFSDKNVDIALASYVLSIVSSKRNIFVFAVARNQTTQPPARYICELSIDGSNKFKKILEMPSEHTSGILFVNSTGSKVGYIEQSRQKRFILIHDTNTGKLLSNIDIQETTLDCHVDKIGWLQDDQTIYFQLRTGDIHITSKEAYKRVGLYFIKDDGTNLRRIPQELLLVPLAEDEWSNTGGKPSFWGELIDGSYLLSDSKRKKTQKISAETNLLYKVYPNTKNQTILFENHNTHSGLYKISFSGKFVGCCQWISSKIKNGHLRSIEDIWFVELSTGKKGKVFSFDSSAVGERSTIGIVGWLQD